MAVDPPDEPSRPSGRGDRQRPELAGTSAARPVLDMAFDSGHLDALRANVQACAVKAGLAEDRIADMILAVHELAANAVRHGGGEGQLRIWDQAGALHCQVDDGDIAAAEPDGTPAQTVTNSLPCEPGHGLWIVHRVADRMQSLSGPHGTSVIITFERGSLPFADPYRSRILTVRGSLPFGGRSVLCKSSRYAKDPLWFLTAHRHRSLAQAQKACTRESVLHNAHGLKVSRAAPTGAAPPARDR
jgi:anti-sigma regulatory factor (Ser/Thr protein kinase)